jgi:hypothetical protein
MEQSAAFCPAPPYSRIRSLVNKLPSNMPSVYADVAIAVVVAVNENKPLDLYPSGVVADAWETSR